MNLSKFRTAARRLFVASAVGTLCGVPLPAQESPGSAPAPAFSLFATLYGRAVDEKTAAPLAGVEITIVGTERKTTTDSEGRYRLVGVAPGTCALAFVLPGYEPTTVTEIEAGQERDSIDVAMHAVGDEVIKLEAVTVTDGGPTKNSVMLDRKQAQVAVDMITAADYSKFIATDVSDIVIRMPGFSTTAHGSFAVVRGLAERYNPIMLDGIVLPSSDPERQTPELDLFPTRLVDAVVVNKAFEPRLPATVSGGGVDLRTKPLPEGRFRQIQFGLRADEGALRRDAFRTYQTGGSWDLLALGSRDRPGPPSTLEEFHARLADPKIPLQSSSKRFPLGTRIGAVFEDRFNWGDNGQALGYAMNFTYDTSASGESGRILGITFPSGIDEHTPTRISEDGEAVVFGGQDYHEYVEEVRMGLFASLGYSFNSQHTLEASAFVSQIGLTSVTQLGNGFGALGSYSTLLDLWKQFDTGTFKPGAGDNVADGSFSFSDSLRYRERNLTDLKLGGQHVFPGEHEVKLNWVVARVQASQKEPDFWLLPYALENVGQPTARYRIILGQEGRDPTQYWRNVQENNWTWHLNAETHFDLGGIKHIRAEAGFYRDDTERTFDEIANIFTGRGDPVGENVDELIAAFRRISSSLGYDNVGKPAFAQAERESTAPYGALTLPILADRPGAHRLDLLVGVRVEDFRLSTTGRGSIGNYTGVSLYGTSDMLQFIGGPVVGPDATLADAEAAGRIIVGDTSDDGRVVTGLVEERTVHPALGLTWSPIEHLNLRASYSETVARPSFRETGPYFTRDEVADEVQFGNVYLRQSAVKNWDFRTEYFFPRSADLIAFSLFNKTIAQPIERVALVVTQVSRNTITWANNPADAEIKGAEIEVAKNLGFLGEPGSWFTLGGNGTWIDAKVGHMFNEPNFPGTRETRRLFDQPEWIANAYLTFKHERAGFSSTLSWFAISDVLRSVALDTWSTYIDSHGRLDLAVSQRLGRSWMLRITAKNLTDPERRFIADPNATTENVVLRRFHDGRSYSMSLTRDF